MRKIFFFAILYIIIAPQAYAQPVSGGEPSPTAQDLENQKKLQEDPLFLSLYRGHVDAIVGDLVNKNCKILAEFESGEFTHNVIMIQQKLLPMWLSKHFKLSPAHIYKLQYDAGIIGYSTSQKYVDDCASEATRKIVEDGRNNQECNLQILAGNGKDTSCFSFSK